MRESLRMAELPSRRPSLRRHALLAGALAALLVGCAGGSGAETTAAPAASSPPPTPLDLTPLNESWSEFARLHEAETGRAPARSHTAPDVARVHELFRRAGAFGLSGGYLVARGGDII